MIRHLVLLASVVVVAIAAVIVPMPYYEVQPGSARPVEELISLGGDVTPIDGDLNLLTTRQWTPGAAGALWVALHPDRDLVPAEERTQGTIDLDLYTDIQRQAFRTSFLTAVAVAAQAVDLDVDLSTRAVVAGVLPGGPSDGLLVPADAILSIDGVAVDSAAMLVDELATSEEERRVELEVLRDDEVLDVAVDLRRLEDSARPVLGILVETLAEDPGLPFDAELEDGLRIGGPSAGLMIAVTATDLLLEEDLTRGRTIAGTGTIRLDGTVGRVSGVEQKARAAVEAGATLLLVPAEQVADAAPAAAAGVEVVGVTTLEEALAALRA